VIWDITAGSNNQPAVMRGLYKALALQGQCTTLDTLFASARRRRPTRTARRRSPTPPFTTPPGAPPRRCRATPAYSVSAHKVFDRMPQAVLLFQKIIVLSFGMPGFSV
jgi:hypothetical protein